MSRKVSESLVIAMLSLVTACLVTFASFAADMKGNLDTVDYSHITGWVWSDAKADDLKVELHIYQDSDGEAIVVEGAEVSTAPSSGQGVQYVFSYTPDWSAMGGSSYRVEAYAVSGGQKFLLSGTKTYVSSVTSHIPVGKESTVSAEPGDNAGPGVPKVVKPVEPPKPKRGSSLGMFTTTGYCGCELCCGSGGGRTYSGTVPQSGHTISADISVFPIGTKLMIGDVVYTVEDIGSGVNGRKLDIYYATHEEALAHGTQSQEVFEVIEV